MKHEIVPERNPSFAILGIAAHEVPEFVSECVHEKRLSSIVKTLNNDVLFGTPKEREEAQVALTKLGFL